MSDAQRVAIYLRVSTDKQELENQERQLIPFCERSGWVVYKLYRDVISGKEEKRPAFNKMYRDAHQKKFNLVLFWDVCRFSRAGALFTLQKFKELDNLGIRWKSYQEPFLDSGGDFSDVIISIFSTFAKMERIKISSRTKAGLERAKAKGVQLGRRSTITDNQIKKVWDEYEREGTISRAAKVAPFSKGTVYFIIKEYVHSREEYLLARQRKRQVQMEKEAKDEVKRRDHKLDYAGAELKANNPETTKDRKRKKGGSGGGTAGFISAMGG